MYASQQCTDPEELYLSSFKDPDYFIFWKSQDVSSLLSDGLANCVHIELSSLSPDPDGLFFIVDLMWYMDMYVYQAGKFLESYEREEFLRLDSTNDFEYTMEYEVKSTEDKKCNPELEYSKDDCIWNEVTTVSVSFYQELLTT